MKSFRKGTYAHCQRCIMRLLEESPLPWTTGMLREWYGKTVQVPDALDKMLMTRRVWRCAPGLYTAITRYEEDRRPVTDEMLARFGFNL